MRDPKNILVTGGAGFIGINFIKYLFSQPSFVGKVCNLDALTYAGNRLALKDVEEKYKGRYIFLNGDICEEKKVRNILKKYSIDTIVHFAAESHVDRSILGPKSFINTNIVGTFTLLEAARSFWGTRDDVLFHHISTDEVFGTLGDVGTFNEYTAYNPRSPYSASKASSDHLVRAYHHTFGLPITISNCSNNYGPYQFPEKFIPLMITNILEKKPLPVYGDGKNIRDWLFVEDHIEAIWNIIQKGVVGESYAIGGENEWQNIKLLHELCHIVAEEANLELDNVLNTITYVKDRAGHDKRYAIDCTKIKKELGWQQRVTFFEGLKKTVRWYITNLDWICQIQTANYNKWIDNNYGQR